MSYILGIDLGTTNCCAAVYKDGKEKIIINAEGNRTTPSVVSYVNGTVQIGQSAKEAEIANPGCSISSVKRYMGSNKIFKIDDKELSPSFISGLILQKIKDDAEAFLNEKITNVVITVPAYFDDTQRQATIDAGRIAGMNVLRILNEPSAAALAYSIDEKKEDKKVMVFDFGGGTLDVSIVRIKNDSVVVISTSGINDLGGDDIDNAIVQMLVSDFYRENKINLKNNPVAMARLKDAAEKAKKALTTSEEYDINLPNIYIGTKNNKHIQTILTREKFEKLIEPVLKNIARPIITAVKDAKLEMSDIDEVLLTGGSTRIPYVQNKIQEITGKQLKKTISPDEAVAIGAAIQGSIIAGDSNIQFSDITSLSLSLRTASDLVRVIIPRNTRIPCNRSYDFATSLDNQTDVIIEVFQGERDFYYDNKKIGHFMLDGLTKAPAGQTKVRVTFDIDNNGVLKVSAEEIGTEVKGTIEVKDFLKLTEREIKEAYRIAEYFKEKDAYRRDIVIEKQNAKNLIRLLDDIMNGDIDLTDEEIEQIEIFRNREELFINNQNPTEEELDSLVNDNIIIKSFIINVKKRDYDSQNQ